MGTANQRDDLPGLAAEPFDRWLRATLPQLLDGGQWQAEVISGGLSNITYRLRTAHARLIVRRPPLGGVLPSAHDMRREYRVLTALAGTAVPVPRTIALCTDETVLGAPFYLMTEVRGTVLRMPADAAALTTAQRRALGAALVSALADVHAVDVDAVGLSDYGRPVGYPLRQVRRWGEQWARSRTRDLADMDRLLAALTARVPAHSEGTVVHGDFRLDNTVVDLDRPLPRIAALLDWELSTLGDPLADLGLAVIYWHSAEGIDALASAAVTAQEGFPSSDDFIQAYAARTGRDVTALPFYLALAAMKLAVVLEGVHARHLGGHTVSDGYAGAGAGVPALVARGLRLLRAEV